MVHSYLQLTWLVTLDPTTTTAATTTTTRQQLLSCLVTQLDQMPLCSQAALQ